MGLCEWIRGRGGEEGVPRLEEVHVRRHVWEAELGESIAPENGDVDNAAAGESAEVNEEEEAPVGGLMAMMKKNREKRKKKGLSENFVDGENAPGAEPAPTTKVATSNRSSFYKNPSLDDAEGQEEQGKSKVGLETFTSDHKKTLDSLKSFGGSSEFDTVNTDPLAPMPPRAFGSGPKLGGRKGGKTLGMRRKV